MKLAHRMSRLGTETAFEVLVRARALEAQDRDIIHLEVGEPDFDTPANIIEAGCHALKTGWTHYGPAAGRQPELELAVLSRQCLDHRIPDQPAPDREARAGTRCATKPAPSWTLAVPGTTSP